MTMPHKGYKQTKEHTQKIIKSKTGIKFSSEHKNKISMALRGEKCHFWKGGRTLQPGYNNNKRVYNPEYKLWRKSVFERDCYTCQVCHQVGGYLTAHHIKSWVNYPELRLDINNGITLCEDCHKLTDNYKGKSRRKKAYSTNNQNSRTCYSKD